MVVASTAVFRQESASGLPWVPVSPLALGSVSQLVWASQQAQQARAAALAYTQEVPPQRRKRAQERMLYSLVKRPFFAWAGSQRQWTFAFSNLQPETAG